MTTAGRILLVILLILLILVAFAVARPGGALRANAAGVVGGAIARRRTGGARATGAGELARPASHPHDLHPIGIALERYARLLGPADAIGLHPLDRGRYEAPATLGGTLAAKGRAPPKPARPWAEYDTWEALQKDEGASIEYLRQRAAVLDNPDLDWGPVLDEVAPKLAENCEYIGLVNLEADGRTLRLALLEKSPVEAGTMESETAFAGVPAELVAKVAKRPALFMFHTHPNDPRGSPLPSSHDLSTSIYFGAASRYAASAVISRFGVLVYGLDWSGYKGIREAKDGQLALLNLSHDVVAAHEALRSWAEYGLADYTSFYPRHRLLFFAYPSPEMVGDARRFRYLWPLDAPIDHDLLDEHHKEITEHREKKQKDQRAVPPTRASIGLD